MNDSPTPAAPPAKSNFPFFKNVSQATEFAREVLGPKARVLVGSYNVQVASFGFPAEIGPTGYEEVATYERRQGFVVVLDRSVLAGGPSINDAFETGFKEGVIPNKAKVFKREPRVISRKMAARAAEGKTKGAIRAGKA